MHPRRAVPPLVGVPGASLEGVTPPTVATTRIASDETESGEISINSSDYDPQLHTLAPGEQAPVPTPRPAVPVAPADPHPPANTRTVRILSDEAPGGVMIIGIADFDPARHQIAPAEDTSTL